MGVSVNGRLPRNRRDNGGVGVIEKFAFEALTAGQRIRKIGGAAGSVMLSG